MFLGVSVSVRGVEMNETERAELAALLREVRTSRFRGSKKAAYNAAGVNAATWDRAERGESIKEHTQVAIVSALWPETGGDWTKIGVDTDDGVGLTTWEDLKNPRYDARHMAKRLDELASENADLKRRLAAAEERIEELYPSDPRTPEEAAEDSRTFAAMAEQFEAEARALGLTDAEYLQHLRSEWGEPIESPLAARRGVSEGRQLRRVQDEAGEENQDNGGEGGA
jgi:hypothetical protein